jgi:hypothetical protein
MSIKNIIPDKVISIQTIIPPDTPSYLQRLPAIDFSLDKKL